MPAVQRSEFALALNQVASERGVDVAVVLDTVKNAILAAYRKDHPTIVVEEFTAELNPNTGEAHILHDKKDVTPPGFGRIAAQTARQVILQRIREKEKEAIISDYKVKIGTVVSGMVLRFAGGDIIIDIGKTEAVMPLAQQVSNERYHLNQRLPVYLLEIRQGTRGEEIIVSRAHTGLIEGLFKREVPEVSQGSVQIKAIVREPGHRAKVAVFSNQPGIDPVGSCVGQKGSRVQTVIQELGGNEKIDIIQYQEGIQSYIAHALSPAKSIRVVIDEEKKLARVFAPKEELSLAIGKEGQNVRLASKLTGYALEIEEEAKLSAAEEDETTKGEASPKEVEATSSVVEAKSDLADAKEEAPKEEAPKEIAQPAESKPQETDPQKTKKRKSRTAKKVSEVQKNE